MEVHVLTFKKLTEQRATQLLCDTSMFLMIFVNYKGIGLEDVAVDYFRCWL